MSKADGSNFDWKNGERVTRQIGRYKLSFTVRVNAGADILSARPLGYASAAFGNTKSGYRTFTPYGDDTSKPVLYAAMDVAGRLLVRPSLENITLKDENNVDVPNFQIMMADAEMTTQAGFVNEMISLDNRGAQFNRSID